MARTRVEVITSVERRRRWGAAEKERPVADEPATVVSVLAREAGLHPSQLYKWRYQRCSRQRIAPDFVPVRIIAEKTAAGLPAPVGVIEMFSREETGVLFAGAFQGWADARDPCPPAAGLPPGLRTLCSIHELD